MAAARRPGGTVESASSRWSTRKSRGSLPSPIAPGIEGADPLDGLFDAHRYSMK